MPVRTRLFSLASIFLLAGCLGTLPAQRAANANATYQQLRGLLPGSEVITVKDFELKRDAATFTFSSGSFAFYGQVNGKVTGAVFKGRGHLRIIPPNDEESRNLFLQMHTEESLTRTSIRWCCGSPTPPPMSSTVPQQDSGQADNDLIRAGQELQTFLRHHSEGARSMEDDGHATTMTKRSMEISICVSSKTSSAPPQADTSWPRCTASKYSHLFFILDPHGIDEVAPEEVALLNWDSTNDVETIPLAFHRAAEYSSGTANGNEHNTPTRILDEDLDVTIEKSGLLSDVATVDVRAEQDGVAVIPLALYPSLRVSQVTASNGASLDWVQENKDEDSDFGVVLAAPLKKGDTTTVKVTYSGHDVVMNEGNGDYYPVARENWYPNSNQGFGDYATYHMLFHIPPEFQIIATGTKVSEAKAGKFTNSEWKTETPLPVVGFSFGDFKMKETKLSLPSGGELTIDAYANTSPPTAVQQLAEDPQEGESLGTLATTPMIANELSQGAAAAQIYTDYFGPLPFPHISLTQQSACDYGQSWPMLVYLPICAFFDATQRHFLGLSDFSAATYWQIVTPHEVAHQWWGHTIGFRGYRDQWMSEGFADESASIFLQYTRPKLDDFLEFWKEQRRILTEKNEFGFRPIDVGPVTMGARLSSPKTGFNVYEDLVYPKGAFILHMIRMMMWTPKEGDARFKETMHDFVNTYRLQAATTEDFKAIVEKHMSPGMDLEGNHRMDWFFREYVYGTDLPAYHFLGEATPNDAGVSLHVMLTQSGVPPNFRMLVPIYLEFVDGTVTHLGSFVAIGDTTIDKTIQLAKLPAAVKRVSINNYYDVLCTDN